MRTLVNFHIGDIVTRRSYGGDVYFKVIDIENNRSEPIYVLKGLLHRLIADSKASDLQKHRAIDAFRNIRKALSESEILMRKRAYKYAIKLNRFRARPGKVLHIDGDSEFMRRCIKIYDKAGIRSTGKTINEPEQPKHVRNLLMQEKPDILVVTGHDSLKKGADYTSVESYSTSKYFIECVKEARKYEPNFDKLCIFAGACQSYYEMIMTAGANFGSSPARILINALDPALVAEKIAVTDERIIVTPREIADVTISGSDGIGGINTRGHLFIK